MSRHFRAAGEWLAELHGATRQAGVSSFAPGREERALVELRRIDGGRPAAGSELLEELDRLCRVHPVRPVAGHGDFWSRNLLLTEAERGRWGGTAVVDWDHSEPTAPPWVDLLHFAVSYGADYPWSRYRWSPLTDAFRRTFLEENPVSRQMRAYLGRYAERTGLAPVLLRPLLRLYLLRRARDATGRRRRRWLACEALLAGAARPALPRSS